MKIWKSTNLVAVATCATLLGTGFSHSDTLAQAKPGKTIQVELVYSSAGINNPKSGLGTIEVTLPRNKLHSISSNKVRKLQRGGYIQIENAFDVSGLDSFEVKISPLSATLVVGVPERGESLKAAPWKPPVTCKATLRPDMKAVRISTNLESCVVLKTAPK